MEFHNNPNPKRARDLWGVPFESPSFSVPLTSTIGINSVPVSCGIEYSDYSITNSGAYTTSTQTYPPVTDWHPRKRIKTENMSPSTPSGRGPSFQHGPSTVVQSPERPPQQHHGHGFEPALVAPSTGGSSGGSSLTRRVMEFGSRLCPCCGFDLLSAPAEYQQIPATPQDSIGVDIPYSAEKPPSMQAFSSSPYSADPMNSEPKPLGYTDQPCTAYQQQVASFASDDTSFSAPLVPGVSGSLGQLSLDTSVKLEPPRSADQPFFPSEHPLDEAVPPLSYGPHVVEGVVAQGVYNHGQAVSSAPPQYNALPDRIAAERPCPPPRDDVSPTDNKSNFDIVQPHQRGGKRGPFKDAALREQTAQTRKIGCCIRCRMQRIRCDLNENDPAGACLTCQKVAGTRAGRFPCLRLKITDVKLYKPGQVPGYEWSRRWKDNVPGPISKWASSEPKVVRISEGYSNDYLEIVVKRFIPQDGDKLERTWYHNGEKKSAAIPPYASVNLETLKDAYMKHIHNSMGQVFTKIVGRNGLLYKTYHQTLNLCKDPSMPSDSLQLIRDTFRLWMSIRFSTTSCFIVGDETLGMPSDILDETSPHSGKIPLPPVLGAQLDMVLIHDIQSRLRRLVLERLEKIISKRKHNTWIVSYLVIFVLLHNTALITAHDAGYARKHGMDRQFAREDKVKEYHAGANILLAYFHYCNKNILPFGDECKDFDLENLAGLDKDQIEFVHTTRSMVKEKKEEWARIRDNKDVENDYYFISQLFEENWEPRSTF